MGGCWSGASPDAHPLFNLFCSCCFAGGHLLEEEPLQLFKWRLCGSLLAALSAALGEAEANGDGGGLGTVETAAVGSGHSAVLAGKVSEKGVLQLLFDVRFLLDLLSGGRPISTR